MPSACTAGHQDNAWLIQHGWFSIDDSSRLIQHAQSSPAKAHMHCGSGLPFLLLQYKWHLPSDAASYSVYIPEADIISGHANVVQTLKTFSAAAVSCAASFLQMSQKPQLHASASSAFWLLPFDF